MQTRLSRRDFLKLAGLLPFSVTAPRILRELHPAAPVQAKARNVLVVVFDAFSAHHISLYGYPRETTPNLARLAERAIVYHNHSAGGNFTTPGTASLLTGVLPWTHRAFTLNTTVDASFTRKSIFRAFQDHYRIAYSHNNVVNTLFNQFHEDVDELIPRMQLYLTSDGFINTLFGKDDDIASVSWVRAMKKAEEGYAYSLFLSRLYEMLQEGQLRELKELFPRGIPGVSGDNYFLLEQGIDWLGNRLNRIPQPFFGYFHFLPPHYPYRTRRDFYGRFNDDGFKPVDKPLDIFRLDKSSSPSYGNQSGAAMLADRRNYDEFALYVDQEFGRFFAALESSGLLDDTWVVFTSDHGEMFERGIVGHSTAVLFQPVIHIPLLIFEPGRKSRLDVYNPTSAVDILPTLLHVTGQKPADWAEGAVLPPFGETPPDPGRSIYALQARGAEKSGPIDEATAMLVRGGYKLAYYFGYKRLGLGGERIELYNIEDDPEELNNLYTSQRGLAAGLLDELKLKLAEVNKPYL